MTIAQLEELLQILMFFWSLLDSFLVKDAEELMAIHQRDIALHFAVGCCVRLDILHKDDVDEELLDGQLVFHQVHHQVDEDVD